MSFRFAIDFVQALEKPDMALAYFVYLKQVTTHKDDALTSSFCPFSSYWVAALQLLELQDSSF